MKTFIYLVFILLLLGNSKAIIGQRCCVSQTKPLSLHADLLVKPLQFRQGLQCKLIFHVFYTKPEEQLSLLQIHSQMEVLNAYFHEEVYLDDINLPKAFRPIKTNPNIQFCLADKDPKGSPSSGINWIAIADRSLACKTEFGKRSLMHQNLGGIDLWDPTHYINVFVINRDQCPVLGEAIYPWNATIEEDGIILDYRSIGTIGTAQENNPYHQGKTLVHEMGHYFGLLHLSADKSDCTGDDGVADTPKQSLEYNACPTYPQSSCSQDDQFMNFMSLVDDACMKLFTKGQVSRMHEQIMLFRPSIGMMNCSIQSSIDLKHIILRQKDLDWQLFSREKGVFNGHLELFNLEGQLLWQKLLKEVQSVTLSADSMAVNPGVYFLLFTDQGKKQCYKIILVR